MMNLFNNTVLLKIIDTNMFKKSKIIFFTHVEKRLKHIG